MPCSVRRPKARRPLQEDLDTWLRFYNEEHSHQGYRTQGRTPWQAFQDGVAAMNQPQAA